MKPLRLSFNPCPKSIGPWRLFEWMLLAVLIGILNNAGKGIIFDKYRWLNKLNRKDSDDLPWTQQED